MPGLVTSRALGWEVNASMIWGETCVHRGEAEAAAAASWLARKSKVPAKVPPSSTCLCAHAKIRQP